MVTIINQIKQQFYDILSSDLKYNVMDNPYDQTEGSFPFVKISMQNTTRDTFKNCFQYTIKYKIDIFSNYDGEKEILEMEEAIYDKALKIYDNKNVTYVRESQFRILDDNSAGVLRKHGIIVYTIIIAGGETPMKEEATND